MSKLKKCGGKEGFQRMNYLYQVSNMMATQNAANNVASSFYTNLLVNVSKKTVQRMDIDIKRTICKGCRNILLVGVNCKVRLKKKKLMWTCTYCTRAKTFYVKDKDYTPWVQRTESVVEILDYNPTNNVDSTRKETYLMQ